MRLHTTRRAPNPRRVHMFLAEKGLEIETVEVALDGATAGGGAGVVSGCGGRSMRARSAGVWNSRPRDSAWAAGPERSGRVTARAASAAAWVENMRISPQI